MRKPIVILSLIILASINTPAAWSYRWGGYGGYYPNGWMNALRYLGGGYYPGGYYNGLNNGGYYNNWNGNPWRYRNHCHRHHRRYWW